MQRFIAVLCAAFLFTSCGKDNSVGSGGPGGYSVPYLATGAETYVTTTTGKDSLNNVLVYDVDSEYVRIDGVGEMLDGYTGLSRVMAASLNHNLGTESVWYKADADSLVEVAYSGAGRVPVILPKGKSTAISSPLSIPSLVWRKIVEKTGNDSILARTDPRVVNRYPFYPGKSWVSFQNPWLEEREVVGSEMVTVKAGTFDCTKIRTTITMGGEQLDMEWFDYVCWQGLILRTVTMPSVTFTTGSSPDSGVVGSSTQRVELVSMN
ncbi:MAG TPA: hypothetical protein VMG34_02820 [Bacteroidota bacterium]|nr:hypothetical protein [Bacteroidota bacterium]